MVRYFDLIENDDVVVNLLSFLDFRAAVQAGRTCKLLKRASDGALDSWVAESLDKAKKDLIASGCNNAECYLSLGWSADHQTKAALIETALEHCEPGAIFWPSRQAQENYDRTGADRARYLLRTRGRVDLEDILSGEEGYEPNDEIECTTNIKFTEAMPFAQAAGCMDKILRKLHELDNDDDLEEEDVLRMEHHTICLLRKADRSSIRYSHLHSKSVHVDFAVGTTHTLFQLPEHDDAKVELFYSESFENY